jgi:hypothetical protein
MHALLVVSALVGQLQLVDGDKEVRLSLSEGLVLKSGAKQVVLKGAGAVGKNDGGTAFTGIAQSKTHACADGEDVDVGGTNNQISLTGRCGKVSVEGIGNTVSIDTAANIDVAGRNNTVTYASGKPAVNKTGVGAKVLLLKESPPAD